jgi:hypothetical protein
MTNSEPRFTKESQSKPSLVGEQKFTISRLNFARHIIALILTILLCFCLFMSELSHFVKNHQMVILSKMTPIYMLLIGFSLLMAIKAVLSVKQIKITAAGIEINNLFWHEKLNWSELKALQAPKNLRFAWFKTKRSIYLFIKKEFENYSELETLIGQFLPIES